MKPSWVLSDEERNRRFNKFNKLKQKSPGSGSDKSSISRKNVRLIPQLYITFTLEEQKLLDFIKNKFNFCHQSWMRNLLMFDRTAGINLLEAAYKLAPLNTAHYKSMQKACYVYFAKSILPTVLKMDELPTQAKAAIANGRNSGMSHFFKVSQCLRMERKEEAIIVKNEEMCPLQRQVAEIAANHDMVETYDLSQILTKIKVGSPFSPQFPTYQEMFPRGWTRESETRDVETRHEQIIDKIQTWPKDDNGQLDHAMIYLMVLILLFNPLGGQVQSDPVEKIQIKYTTLLQRYLKSKLSEKAANKKFLDAIMLISQTTELWDINEKYMV